MHQQRLDFLAMGTALSISVLLVFLVCDFAAYLVPGLHFPTNVVNLFTAAAPGTQRSMVEGITVSISVSWIFTCLLAITYKCLDRNQPRQSSVKENARSNRSG